MKRYMLCVLASCAAATLAVAQAPPPRIIVLNTAEVSIDVRLGEEKEAALKLDGLAPGSVTPPTACSKAGSFAVSVRAAGQAAWTTILENLGEGERGGPERFPFADGAMYALCVGGEGEYLYPYREELAVPAGNRPKVLFVVVQMGPPRFATIASTQNAGDGIAIEELMQYRAKGLYELPSSGKRSIFFAWPAFFGEVMRPFPDAKDQSKPAVFDFRDRGIYAVVLKRFDEERVDATFATLVEGSSPPAAGAAQGGTIAAAPAALTAVPASWNGDWAEERRPTRRALAIHDGKIFLVMGSMETETFPGTTSRLYSFTYAEREVATLLDGKLYERYVLSEDGKKLTNTLEGAVTVYIRLAK